ncbi:MAG TPA: hypothetical protein PKD49_10330 [Hyphomicrobium sp.]|nr:hypothetical protein [Hyphomicrobium sp.]
MRWRQRAALCVALLLMPVAAILLMPALAQEGPQTPARDATAAGSPEKPCGKADFEAVVEEAAGTLRDMNNKNKPAMQEKLRQLKDKRGWTHDQFMREAAPFVRDEKIAEFDRHTEELLDAIASMGQEGASAKKPDCALMLELRARMTVLVATQTAKWGYMFNKIDTELKK